ncbi:MAG: S8 family peptidase [Clostridium sp.]|nr:S8 family peptidase [Acetatifactor muris]MCM1527820.1 S8 family peptidase [Bacteroides sp.]MCM1563500.1 S8 family peptidase [Clostridium sp.]
MDFSYSGSTSDAMNLTDVQQCRERILSENTYDFITDFSLTDFPRPEGISCYEDVDGLYYIIYVNRNLIPNMSIDSSPYQSIPKLYGLMQLSGAGNAFNPDSLIVSGITQVQRAPLNLTGRGCILCFIDTGIDYTMDVFRDLQGDSRILAIWDQTVQSGTPPEGFLYGSEYTREDINRALRSDDPYEVVPSRDENGHGSILAALAAGSATTGTNRYVGVAPDADIVAVKLKECKNYLREFNLIPPGEPAYQENDIMLAIRYADSFARVLSRPVIICLGLGTNMGDHAGSSVLSRYLNVVALRRSRSIVVCGGNEGNAAHHYRGRLRRPGAADDADSDTIVQSNTYEGNVEVRVGENCSGFVLECWSSLPDTLQVGLRSPGGEYIPPARSSSGSVTYRLIYERTIITLDTILVEPGSGEQLIRFRLQDPTPGIWTFQVSFPGALYNGVFDMWLPINEFLDSEVNFLRPDPYITLTEPAMASDVISVSSYNPANLSFAIESGRGYARTGVIRPDLAAPGVNVSTIRGPRTGSSLAAAITAGAVAQFFQWAVVEQRSPFAETRELKSYLIRGAARSADLTYPNREWGYGRLDLEGVFDALIGL